jgi:very-short-patch-repair endonuclease
MCNSRRLCDNEECSTCFNNSFASHEKSKYWSDINVDENGNKINPRQVFKKSNKKYWFDCECGHRFDTSLGNLSGVNNNWCPYCVNKKLCEKKECKSCFEKSFASHEKSKYWSKDNELKPIQVFKFSDKKIIFDCNCGHKFESVLKSISKNTWCPYCCFPTIKVCGKEDCQNCFQKSFASHKKSKYWNYDKNIDESSNKINPIDAIYCSEKAYWFNCDCGHEYYTPLSYLSKSGEGCPYCCNPLKKICDKESCQTCFNNSFASHEKSKYWNHDKNIDESGNKITSRQVIKKSNKKYWFDCECGHSFESALGNIACSNQWCSYCCKPPKKLCDCQICFEKSFASNNKSKYWSYDKNIDENGNKIQPKDIFKCSGKKYWFTCEKKHLFDCTLNNVNNGFWCPICVNKTEKKLYEQLLQIYPNTIYRFSTDWCKNPNTNSYLPFDFVLKEQKIIIELDGPQHFVQIMNWKSPEEQFENDQYKEKCANDNGYSVIRILQTDVLYDTYDWLTELKKSIEQIVNEKIIQNNYLSMNNEYENFN